MEKPHGGDVRLWYRSSPEAPVFEFAGVEDDGLAHAVAPSRGAQEEEGQGGDEAAEGGARSHNDPTLGYRER